jgi:hypothetical protein
MVRLVDSQWVDDVTFESVLLKVTNQENALLDGGALTLKVVLVVVSVAELLVPDSVFEYD